jgi:hypothetical protein
LLSLVDDGCNTQESLDKNLGIHDFGVCRGILKRVCAWADGDGDGDRVQGGLIGNRVGVEGRKKRVVVLARHAPILIWEAASSKR